MKTEHLIDETVKLLELGIDVKAMGVPLTYCLQEGYHILTY